MGKKYDNPPIVEALCEFQFIPSQSWDMTIPGILFEKIGGEFSVKRQQTRFDIGLLTKKNGIEQKVEMSPPNMQFFRPDKSALVQVGADILTINHLKQYTEWESFKPLILNNLEIYNKIAKPKGFKRIGLRYINKIDFDKDTIELSAYFNYYPTIPTNLPQSHEAFNLRIEFPYEDGRERLHLTLASVIPQKPNLLSLLLDLDYIMDKPELVPLDKVSDWIEKAHTRIENCFEACITDKSRSLFGGMK